MRRRTFVAAGLAGLGAVAGCLGGVNTPPVPDRPDPLNRSSVTDYAAQHRKAIVSERLNDPNVADIEVDCAAVVQAESGDAYYVLADCRGTLQMEGGESGEYAGEPTMYYVAPDATETIEESQLRAVEVDPVYRSGNPDENLGADAVTTVLRGYNFDDRRHELSLSVTHEGSGDTVVERTVEVASRNGVRLADFAVRTGTYRLVASVSGGGASSTAEWTLSASTTAARRSLLITPAGDLRVVGWPGPLSPGGSARIPDRGGG